MQDASRLSQLLQLADRGPAMRAALAEEIAELLIDWPGDCPIEMRHACEEMLARTAHEVDSTILARLRARLHDYPDLAAFVLPPRDADRSLIETARHGGDIPAALSRAFDLPPVIIRSILSDHSGHALAIACKSMRLPRAMFSALAVLIAGKTGMTKIHTRLDAYDAVAMPEAARLLRKWRDSMLAKRAA